MNLEDCCLVLGNILYANGMILAIFESPSCRKPTIKFQLKKIYGLKDDDVKRIPN